MEEKREEKEIPCPTVSISQSSKLKEELKDCERDCGFTVHDSISQTQVNRMSGGFLLPDPCVLTVDTDTRIGTLTS